jgi:hypothetical protein
MGIITFTYKYYMVTLLYMIMYNLFEIICQYYMCHMQRYL